MGEKCAVEHESVDRKVPSGWSHLIIRNAPPLLFPKVLPKYQTIYTPCCQILPHCHFRYSIFADHDAGNSLKHPTAVIRLSGGPLTPTPVREYSGLRGEDRPAGFSIKSRNAAKPPLWLTDSSLKCVDPKFRVLPPHHRYHSKKNYWLSTGDYPTRTWNLGMDFEPGE